MNLRAKAAKFTDDGYCSLLSLADDPTNPQHFVMLSFTNEPDEQDTAMGMAGVHVDLGTFNIDGYDLIEDITYQNNVIIVRIDKQAANELGIDHQIDVILENDDLGGFSANDVVSKFKKRLRLR